MSKYRDLQKEAKKLGLSASGTVDELEKRIAEHKGSESEEVVEDAVEEVEEVEEAVEDLGEEEVEVVKEDESEPNAAIILNDSGNELRRFTLKMHGENFADLARSYAKKHGEIFKLRFVKPEIVCPHCGGKIYRS